MDKIIKYSDSDKIKNKYNLKLVNEFIKYYNFIYTNQDLLDKSPKEIYYKLANIVRVIQIISGYKNKINIEELPNVKKIKYIGDKTINRIKEILETGKLSEIINIKNKEKVIKELIKIHSIGSKRAIELFNKYDIKSINDLKKKFKKGEVKLTYQQELGLKFYDDLTNKIPNIIILSFEVYLQKLVYNIDSNYLIVLCGSFRRNKPYSHDIDILITHKNIKKIEQCKKYLSEILKLLNNFIVGDLIINYKNHFQGYACFKNILKKNYKTDFNLNSIIRVDIIVVPEESFFTGLLHFTGSGSFNKKMRNIAKSRNMKLNEYSLTKNNKKIKIKSEIDIFKHLNMDYVKPDERN